MDFVFTPITRGPVLLQKIVMTTNTILMVGENHLQTDYDCDPSDDWLLKLNNYAETHPDESFHLFTEIGGWQKERLAILEDESPNPINRVCFMERKKKLSKNIDFHDANGRFMAPFHVMEMLYNKDYYGYMSALAKMNKTDGLFHMTTEEKKTFFKKRFRKMENVLLKYVRDEGSLARFVRSVCLGDEPVPTWYLEFLKEFPSPDGSFDHLAVLHHIRSRDADFYDCFVRWIDEHIRVTIAGYDGDYKTNVERQRIGSADNDSSAPKLSRKDSLHRFFRALFSIFQDVYMVLFYCYKTIQSHGDTFLFVVGYEHVFNMNGFFKLLKDVDPKRSSYVRRQDGCLDMSKAEKGIL